MTAQFAYAQGKEVWIMPGYYSGSGFMGTREDAKAACETFVAAHLPMPCWETSGDRNFIHYFSAGWGKLAGTDGPWYGAQYSGCAPESYFIPELSTERCFPLYELIQMWESQCPCFGKPIDPSIGNMWHREVDAMPVSILSVERMYNSTAYSYNSLTVNAFGVRWRSDLDRKLIPEPNFKADKPYGWCGLLNDGVWMYCATGFPTVPSPPIDIRLPAVSVLRGDGKRPIFARNGNAWLAVGDTKDTLVASYDTDGSTIKSWTYTIASDDTREVYSPAGRVLEETTRAGLSKKYTYSNGLTNDSSVGRIPGDAPICSHVQAGSVLSEGRLLCVTDNFGRQIQYEYDSVGRVSKVFDVANQAISYEYDGPSGGCLTPDPNNRACSTNNLTKVTYPDGKSRTYIYNEESQIKTASGGTCGGNFPKIGNGFGNLYNYLTGLEDENGARQMSWTYNCRGFATSSELAGGVEKVTVDYTLGDLGLVTAATVTQIMGTPTNPEFVSSTLTYQRVQGRQKNTAVEKPVVEAGKVASRVVDAIGDTTSSTDFNGSVTNYVYNDRRLEVSRVDGAGTAQARTTTTVWHPQYRIPVQVNEPMLRTTYTHDGKGNVLSKTEQATTDVDGSQGAAAPVVGVPRVWIYTYNNVGQVLTVKGPRTDVNDVTTNVYDAQGNLIGVTNGAGHTTSLSNYDAHGHVGRIVDPNGVVTEMSYHPRGWLLSKSVTADGYTETTNYTYDGVGQLTQVTLPDATQIHYTYDNAHRLISIADHLGNTINYALDNMGNRVKEEVKDSTGNLTRQVTRVYDTLNRLQQVTGGMQ